MAIQGIQNINIGLPNESSNSDSLFTGFTKTQQNFTNLAANASPVPVSGAGITVTDNISNVVISTNLIAGDNIVLTEANGAIVIDAISSGPSGTITGVIAGTGLAGGGYAGNVTLSLANTSVTAGEYTNPTITIDSRGRITGAANNTIAGTVTSVGLSPGSGISVSGGPITSAGTITVTNTGVTRLNAGTGIEVSSANGNVTVSATPPAAVTSVGISSSQLVVSGSPITSTGTINVNLPDDATFAGNVTVGNLIVTGDISPASETKVGGIKAGPGANVSLDGTLTIDTAGLPLSFGNYTANNNVLTIVNTDENMILQTQGNAEIQLVGNIGFYKTNGIPQDTANRYFSATDDGQIQILVSNSDPLLGGVEIVGSTSGNIIAPGTQGTMLHITGQQSDPARVYIDGNDDYVSMVARRWNGNVDTPTQVLSGEYVLRINSTAATDDGVGNVAMAQIGVVALENQTTTAQGSKIEFTVTPIGNTATNRVTVANITVANGVEATKFTTSGTLSVGGNANVGNLGTSSLLLDTTANVSSSTEGLLYWNSADHTLNINHFDDVTQQIGQEQYVLALNETGNTINNGSFVGFDGAGNNGNARIKIATFQANGALPSLYGIGVATQNIANANTGLVTTFGVVRNLDTTGDDVGETWGVGNILYANPDVSGGFTNTKPTAPNNVIPVAAVLKVDDTEGEIFVRPTIDQMMYYGRFSCLTDQTADDINTAYPVVFTNTDIANGIALGTPASRIVIDYSGYYQISVNIQVATTDNNPYLTYAWLRLNGVDIPNSMHRLSVDANANPFASLAIIWSLTLEPTDYIEVVWAAGDTNIRLDASTATAFGPGTAACTIDIIQVQL